MKMMYSDGRAAWYILLDFSNYSHALENVGLKSSNDLHKHLIHGYGLITVSGDEFGVTKYKKYTLRISYIAITEVDIENNKFSYENVK